MFYVVKMVDGRERRVFSRHRKLEAAHRAAGKLRLETGIKGIRVVHRDKDVTKA